MSQEEEEPASPMARMLQAPTLNICVLTVLGFRTTIDVNLLKQELEQTLLKHPRFSSVLIAKNRERGEFSWERTNVDIENHVFTPDLDPNMESPDEFVEDFMSEISKYHMDMTRPLWEFYVLNVKTSKANSTIILKTHHSMGDGVSLISLVMACAKKTSSGSNLPTIFPTTKQKPNIPNNNGMVITRLFTNIWTTFLIIFNTLIDFIWILATLMFLKDTKTPIKGERGIELSPKRFVQRIIDFNDIKLVKSTMNVSVNDVATGVAEAGLNRYLKTRYGQHSKNNSENVKNPNFLPKNLRLTSIVCFNLRPSPFIEDLGDILEDEEKLKGKWGNIIGLAHLPLTMALHDDDPLACVRRAKAAMDRKKQSYEHSCFAMLVILLTKFCGMKSAAALTSTILWNTTLLFSNMMGPPREIAPFGHPLSYMAPTVTGFPQALLVHFQSYADKFIISIDADQKLIPNPHQLCDDMVRSFEDIKDTLIKRGFV